MANEAVLKKNLDVPWDWIVGDSNGIEKGTICTVSGTALTAQASSGSGERFAGIARREKIANDGRTRLALFRRGIFDLKNSAAPAISGGALVCTSGVNLIRAMDANEAVDTSGIAIGRALENIAANGTGEVLLREA